MHKRQRGYPDGDSEAARRRVAGRVGVRVPALAGVGEERRALGAPLLPPRAAAAADASRGDGSRRIQATLHGLRQAGAESARRRRLGPSLDEPRRGSALSVPLLRRLLRAARETRRLRRSVGFGFGSVLAHVPMQAGERLMFMLTIFREV